MKCVICRHGETNNGKTIITVNGNDSTLVIKNVPTKVCSNCGEAYVDGKTPGVILKQAGKMKQMGSEGIVETLEILQDEESTALLKKSIKEYRDGNLLDWEKVKAEVGQ